MTVFGDIFTWMKLTDHLAGILVCIYLPAEYEVLIKVANTLGNANSAVAPFTSLVVNINVHIEGHQDTKDLDFCLALAIGGELVIKKQGLVLELRNGDFIIF